METPEDQEDLSPSPIVARADALMQRRRPGSSLLPEAENLPVLTEVVDPGSDLLAPRPTGEPPQDTGGDSAIDPAVLDILAHELARRLRERLDSELPGLVEAVLQTTMAELAQELQQGLVTSAQNAIHDFLDERARLAKLQQER